MRCNFTFQIGPQVCRPHRCLSLPRCRALLPKSQLALASVFEVNTKLAEFERAGTASRVEFCRKSIRSIQSIGGRDVRPIKASVATRNRLKPRNVLWPRLASTGEREYSIRPTNKLTFLYHDMESLIDGVPGSEVQYIASRE